MLRFSSSPSFDQLARPLSVVRSPSQTPGHGLRRRDRCFWSAACSLDGPCGLPSMAISPPRLAGSPPRMVSAPPSTAWLLHGPQMRRQPSFLCYLPCLHACTCAGLWSLVLRKAEEAGKKRKREEGEADPPLEVPRPTLPTRTLLWADYFDFPILGPFCPPEHPSLP